MAFAAWSDNLHGNVHDMSRIPRYITLPRYLVEHPVSPSRPLYSVRVALRCLDLVIRPSLLSPDDVGAPVRCDTNTDRTFDGANRVLFSPSPDSPSLTGIEDAPETGAAVDVYALAPSRAPRLLAFAEAAKNRSGECAGSLSLLSG